jgi:hypothetical protein
VRWDFHDVMPVFRAPPRSERGRRTKDIRNRTLGTGIGVLSKQYHYGHLLSYFYDILRVGGGENFKTLLPSPSIPSVSCTNFFHSTRLDLNHHNSASKEYLVMHLNKSKAKLSLNRPCRLVATTTPPRAPNLGIIQEFSWEE